MYQLSWFINVESTKIFKKLAASILYCHLHTVHQCTTSRSPVEKTYLLSTKFYTTYPIYCHLALAVEAVCYINVPDISLKDNSTDNSLILYELALFCILTARYCMGCVAQCRLKELLKVHSMHYVGVEKETKVRYYDSCLWKRKITETQCPKKNSDQIKCILQVSSCTKCNVSSLNPVYLVNYRSAYLEVIAQQVFRLPVWIGEKASLV